MAEDNPLPSLISNPSSIRRDHDGFLDERCLTPRSRALRDRVAAELRAEVLREYSHEVPHEEDDDSAHNGHKEEDDGFLQMTLPQIMTIYRERRAKGRQRRRSVSHSNPTMQLNTTDEQNVQITVFHQVTVLLLRDSICWNRLVAVEAFCIERIRNFALLLGTDVQSSFVECLKDKFPPVRRFAIEGFRIMAESGLKLESVHGAAHLRAIALNDTDWRLRAEAARTLATLGERALPELIVILAESTFWPVRCEAAISLGSLEEWKHEDFSESQAQAASRALEAALGDRLPGVRESAAKGLGMMGTYALGTVHQLILLSRDKDLRVRIAAVAALGKIVGQAAPRQHRLHYEILMEKGDISMIETGASFVDWLRLTCRALTRTLRDQEPLYRVAMAAKNTEFQEIEPTSGSPRSIALVEELRAKEREDLEVQRNHVKELFHAAEVSLRQIGAYCGPNMVARLIDEEQDNCGLANRMSLLRGLHCSGHGFNSDDITCVILSEWISAITFESKNLTAVANALPVSGLHLDTFSQDSSDFTRCSVLHGDADDVYIVFGVLKHTKAVDDFVADTRPQPVEIKVEGGGTQTVSVHSGIWQLLDGLWQDLGLSLEQVLAKLRSLRRLVICGGGMAGALAKAAVLRFHAEELPLAGMQFPTPDSGTGHAEKASGIILKSYGAPNVLHGDRPQLMHCSQKSRCWVLVNDCLPVLLNPSGQVHGVQEVLAKKPQTGCCHRRVREKPKMLAMMWSSTYEGMFDGEALAPSPRDTRSNSMHGLSVSLRSYTNSLCWHTLTQRMKP